MIEKLAIFVKKSVCKFVCTASFHLLKFAKLMKFVGLKKYLCVWHTQLMLELCWYAVPLDWVREVVVHRHIMWTGENSTPSKEWPLCTPPTPVIRAHLKAFVCLWHKSGTNLSESWRRFERMRGWLWTIVGLGLGNRLNIIYLSRRFNLLQTLMN